MNEERRISINFSKQKLFSLQNSRSTSSSASYNLKEDFEGNKKESQKAEVLDSYNKRKYANSIVEQPKSDLIKVNQVANLPLSLQK